MSTSTLISIQNQMNFYGYPILMVVGSIGSIFILLVFNRQRQNACSLYLMNSAIASLLYLTSFGFFRIFSVSYYDQTLGALLLCKFSNYVLAAFGPMAATMLMFACIDRYMITSPRAAVRALSTRKRAKYLIILSYIFWIITSFHVFIWMTPKNGQCVAVGSYQTFVTFHALVVVGLIPTATLCIFGYLTLRNMKQLLRRIQPNGENTNHSLQRRDRDLLVIVLAEVIVYVIITSLFPVALLETTISGYMIPNKSIQYIVSEIFALNLGILLLFLYNASSFYTYMMSSKAFRGDFKQLVIKCYRKTTRQAADQTTLRTRTQITQRTTRV